LWAVFADAHVILYHGLGGAAGPARKRRADRRQLDAAALAGRDGGVRDHLQRRDDVHPAEDRGHLRAPASLRRGARDRRSRDPRAPRSTHQTFQRSAAPHAPTGVAAHPSALGRVGQEPGIQGAGHSPRRALGRKRRIAAPASAGGRARCRAALGSTATPSAARRLAQLRCRPDVSKRMCAFPRRCSLACWPLPCRRRQRHAGDAPTEPIRDVSRVDCGCLIRRREVNAPGVCQPPSTGLHCARNGRRCTFSPHDLRVCVRHDTCVRPGPTAARLWQRRRRRRAGGARRDDGGTHRRGIQHRGLPGTHGRASRWRACALARSCTHGAPLWA